MHQMKRNLDDGKEIIELDLNPLEILRDPLLNKGCAFTEKEREELALHGLIPQKISTIEEQVKEHALAFSLQKEPLSKYIYLSSLQNQNETLFYRFCNEYPAEVLPYIYTPTVGEASLHFSKLYRHPRGLYLSYPNRDKIDAIVSQIPREAIDVIVVTDGSRVLGLGDLGMGGMAISIGKLALYSLFGGVHPARTLPVILDVGTSNETLLNDPSYLGWKSNRVTGKEYDDFVATFVRAITKRYPHVLIQWEDFSKEIAGPLLETYQNQICCFNDDIQGTAGVTLAGIFAALKGSGADIKDQRIVFFGAGSAGIGVAKLMVKAMLEAGMTDDDAKKTMYVLGRDGLAHTGSKNLDSLKALFAQEEKVIANWAVKDRKKITLLETVRHAKPTILIGTSTQSGAFTEEIIREMHKHVKRPIIFPLSNPTSKSEAHPADLIKWTNECALIATGSPYPPVQYNQKEYPIGQCNNVCIFPGVGQGIIASRAIRVTDQMFLKAAQTLSGYSPFFQKSDGSLFPCLTELRSVSQAIAIAVAKEAIREGICLDPPKDIEKAVVENMWNAQYPTLRKINR